MAVKWTQEMDEFLRIHYMSKSKREIASKLGVSFNAVSNRMKSLHLIRNDDIRIGGKYFAKEKAEEILKRCLKEPIVQIARELEIKSSCLWMFMRRRQVPSVIAYEKKRREERLKKTAEKRRSAEENHKKTISNTIRPLRHRLREGGFYYVPLEQKIGAYKVKETGSPFDERMFEKGWYFATEREAVVFSQLTQKRYNDDKEFEELKID